MKRCAFVLGLLLASCSDELPRDAPPGPPSVTAEKERRDELKTTFGRALATALADSPSLRHALKTEALRMFDKDYDVLYALIKDQRLSDGKTVRELLSGYLESEQQLLEIEEALPLLTIFVPKLPENTFSARLWDADRQIPSVGVTSSKTNDVTLIDQHGAEYTLKAHLIPGFPVVVVKENERVVPVQGDHRSLAQGSVFRASGDQRFAFLADCFDGSIPSRVSAQRIDFNPDSKLVDAYNIYAGTDGWHRDYIYYNITPSQDRGAFSYAYQEQVRSFRMVGDPQTAYSKISDQTGDPRLSSFAVEPNSGWTGGYFEFKVRVLLNSKNGLGEELVTYFNALPDELFKVEYQQAPAPFESFYLPHITGLQTKYMSLPLFPWDLNDYASTIKIEIEEVDTPTTVVTSESRTVKFAANFSIDLGVLKKIGIKFGASYEDTRTQTTQRTFTEGNDLLGAVIVNFADNVLVGKGSLPFLGEYWNSREYPSGWYSISVEPTRVQ
jgi:hypothetical protein